MRALPMVVEYGLTDRTELPIEPVFVTAIRHRNSPSATGPGDVEVTLTHLIQPNLEARPGVTYRFSTRQGRLWP